MSYLLCVLVNPNERHIARPCVFVNPDDTLGYRSISRLQRVIAAEEVCVKGDRVEVVVDIGDGTKTYEIVATKAGRRVEISNARGTIEVSEVTRTGVIVRSGRFMAARVIAMIEHPAEDEQQPRKTTKKNRSQASLL